nr:MAG TPA: hypothetical protein [Caudoviricetes sp.]
MIRFVYKGIKLPKASKPLVNSRPIAERFHADYRTYGRTNRIHSLQDIVDEYSCTSFSSFKCYNLTYHNLVLSHFNKL